MALSRKLIKTGQSLVEILVAIGISAIILPALYTGLLSSRQGKYQSIQYTLANILLSETVEAAKTVRESGWTSFAVNGTYYPVVSGSNWILLPGTQLTGDFSRSIIISDVNRDSNGNIVTSGGTPDPSTKKVVTTVSWSVPVTASISDTSYFTRYLDNLVFTQTLESEFNLGTKVNTTVMNTSGGEFRISDNNKAKWCSPEFSPSTIDLPDGPPVAVAARTNVNTSIPNDVLVDTAPTATSSVKMAYLTVTANTDPPASSLSGKFTLDSGQYSNPSYVPASIGLDNNFKTNDIAYYTSSSNKLYALIATNKPDREVIAVLVDNTDLQDPVNLIYKYKTFFNTRQYQGDNRSTPNQDHAPFGYGGVSISVLGDRGYLLSSGYLYVFNLSNIDTKSTSSGLDMVGCRIQLDGYDCNPGSGTDRKYSAGETGASWSDTTSPAHNDCSDGGNIELYADNDIYPVLVGSSTYVYVAVGAGTNPEFDIVNVTNVPSNSSNPRINNSSCGRISGGNSGWKRISSLDFNSSSGTEEAANSVYAKSDGTRAYISSNGGIDGNNDGQPDSKQFYVINTTNKSSPAFLSGNSTTGATSGFYQGSGANGEMFPRRSLTVLNGERVVLVGRDGTSNENDALEYQVLNSSDEANPSYCGGLNFDQGFNDLTSVSEPDTDNFVYMVANTTLNELKIIQGGPDGRYMDSGTFESSIFDPGYQAAFNRYFTNFTTPANTAVSFQVSGADAVSGSCSLATYSYVGPDGTSGTFFTDTNGRIPLNDDGSGYENPARCFRYKSYLSTTDFNVTPFVSDFSINYSP